MEWYEAEVQRVEEEISKLDYNPQMLFYGSSSLRLWNELYEDFKIYLPVNLAFGGSTLEACVYFFQRIMKSFDPKYFVIYAGDNDLGDGRNAEDVHGFFVQLCECINKSFGNVPVWYISIKPSLHRWKINDAILRTNSLIQQTINKHGNNLFFVDVYSSMIGNDGLPVKKFYMEDGLHLSKEGYQLWKDILLTHISSNIDSSLIMVS